MCNEFTYSSGHMGLQSICDIVSKLKLTSNTVLVVLYVILEAEVTVLLQ